jgi:hypothetical protein
LGQIPYRKPRWCVEVAWVLVPHCPARWKLTNLYVNARESLHMRKNKE